jgi:hypothetical protein
VPTAPGFVHELKLDRYRLQAHLRGAKCRAFWHVTACSSAEGMARVWDAATGKQFAVLVADNGGYALHSAALTTTARASSQRRRAARRAFGTVRPQRRWQRCGTRVKCIPLPSLPDGRRIATTSGDSLRIRDAATAREIAVPRAHESLVSGAFQPRWVTYCHSVIGSNRTHLGRPLRNNGDAGSRSRSLCPPVARPYQAQPR